MQTSHTGATKLEALAAGQPFRFYFRGERVIGIKAQFPRGMDAALVLSSTPALLTGGLLSGFDVGDVIALPDAKIIPSSRPDANSAGAGNFAQPGEIELHGNELIFVTQPHGDQRITYRVNLKSGDIGRSSGTAPVEIYSEWSIQDGIETLHQRKAAVTDDKAGSIVVAVG
jgi:hypothetical protein